MTTNYRIKCKLCECTMLPQDGDIVICKCGEITLDGIDKKIYIKQIESSYCEIDDQGNEIVQPKPDNIVTEPKEPVTKEEVIQLLNNMIANIEAMPPEAMTASVNQYDLLSILLLVSSFFKAY